MTGRNTIPKWVGNVLSPHISSSKIWILCIALTVLAAAGLGFGYYYRPQRLNVPLPAIAESIAVSPTGTRVFIPNRILLGEIAEFDDGLFAFLMFDYLRGRSSLAHKTMMLTSQEEQDQPVYRVLVRLPDDLMAGVNILAQLQAERLTTGIRFNWVLLSTVESYVHETSVFIEAYNGPATKRLKTLHASELQGYLRSFIRFKSKTDPRIAGAMEPVPSPLTRKDASRLAADVLAVAHFYNIPIALFLGIGAMENNYMNVAGDLKNTIWKRHAQAGDIVLRHRRGRVLVRNDSMGVWQITRETLRYAHQLYLQDKRDYKLLPSRLRPPGKLDFNSVDADVLTTYAGVLLRDLLDQFHGDVTLAAGAYNGGPGNPNVRYAAGVEMVADYARRVIGRAAQMDRIAMENNSISTRKIKEASARMKGKALE